MKDKIVFIKKLKTQIVFAPSNDLSLKGIERGLFFLFRIHSEKSNLNDEEAIEE